MLFFGVEMKEKERKNRNSTLYNFLLRFFAQIETKENAQKIQRK